MKVRLTRFEGATDGLRFGAGVRPQAHGGGAGFGWSYDALNDVLRLWRSAGDTFGERREFRDPQLAAIARRLVRARMGLADVEAPVGHRFEVDAVAVAGAELVVG